MRKLTKTEIKNKPWWAKSYSIQVQTGEPIFYAEKGGGKMPIPNEEFDIHSVRFSDDNIDCLGHCNDETLWTYFKADTAHTSESRADVIAKAKHFKLTVEDLR